MSVRSSLAPSLLLGAAILIVACDSGVETPQSATPTGAKAIAVAPLSATLTMGDTLTLVATATDANGDTIQNPGVLWVTLHPNIATISPTGLVTAVAPGTDSIAATSGYAATVVPLTVNPPSTDSVSVVPAAVTIATGSSFTLRALVRTVAGDSIPGATVTWSSQSASIATVAASGSLTGTVTGVKPGTTTVTATAGPSTAPVIVTVVPAVVVSLSAAHTPLKLTTGSSQPLVVVAHTASGATVADPPLSWVSAHPTIATVSASGVISAIRPGNDTITVSSGFATLRVPIIVTTPVGPSITITPDTATIAVGATMTLGASIRTPAGAPAGSGPVVWTSSAPSVVSISASGVASGVLTGRTEGRATITATRGSARTTAVITVIPATSDVAGQYASMYLHTTGNRLVTATGKHVLLHGINLGGWLETESWDDDPAATAAAGERAPSDVLERLEARPDIGPARAATLLAAWRSSFITADDIAQIARWHYNLVRVGLDPRDFEDARGNAILDSHGQPDYSTLDWIVRQAGDHRMYVIFDLHSMRSRRQAEALWTNIARHFVGNGAIAGFDVINEPGTQFSLQLALVRAVRAGDPHRVVFVEPEFAREGGMAPPPGADPHAQFVGGTSQYRLFEGLGLTNAVYEVHYPDNTSRPPALGQPPISGAQISAYLTQFSDAKYPIYVGEVKGVDGDASDAELQVLAYDAAEISWSTWTYKSIGTPRSGLVDAIPPSRAPVSLATSTYAQILAAWTGSSASSSPPSIDTDLLAAYEAGNTSAP